jgi:hypothetical protein
MEDNGAFPSTCHGVRLFIVGFGITDTIDVMVEREHLHTHVSVCMLIYHAEKRWEDAYRFLITSQITFVFLFVYIQALYYSPSILLSSWQL